MRLVVVLGGLHALLGLEPDETELVLDVVDHDLLALTTGILLLVLSRGVGTLELEVLVLVLGVLAAVSLPEDTVDLVDLEGVGEKLVTGDDVLDQEKKSQPWPVEIHRLFFIFLIFVLFFCPTRIRRVLDRVEKQPRNRERYSPCR